MSFSEAVERHRLPLLFTLLLAGGLYAPVAASLAAAWYRDPNYSHGFLVPLVSGYILYRKAGVLKDTPVQPDSRGIAVVLTALLLFVAAFLGAEDFTMRVSLVVVLAGLVLTFFGQRVLRTVAFPLVYLLFMVPLPYILYDSVAFPLKLSVAKYSVFFLKAVGIVVWREGNIIMFPSLVLEVADACSGIRSLMSLLALGTAFAYFSQPSPLKRAAVVASALPIALFANALRVVATGILAQYWGGRAAEGFFHEFAGLAVFGLAVVLMVLTSVLVGRAGR
ncbi:MAG: exosortase/archaeosortase family protein [Nitrospirales bacterium]|nr:exosortase/archaeosortase family protein [Nitrospirales bacterium]